MAGVDVGGDTSVEWLVLVDHVRVKPGQSPEHGANPNNPAGWRHHGVDETDPGNFNICIKLPADRQGFFQTVQAAIAEADTKGLADLCFDYPIMSGTPKQIRIKWDSKPPELGKKHNALALMAALEPTVKFGMSATKRKAKTKAKTKGAAKTKTSPKKKAKKAGKKKR